MTTNDRYALNWSNHTTHIRKAFDSLLAGNEFVDVTLACEGKKICAHKMLLSACSTYFHDLFRDNPCQHPIVILKDVKYQNLVDVLKFVYNGEVSVATESFDSFLRTAELLQISGLTDDVNRFSTLERDNAVSNAENALLTAEPMEPVEDLKPVNKIEPVEKPVTKRHDKPKEIKRKIVEKPVEGVAAASKKRKENSVLKEPIQVKKEEETEVQNFVEDEPAEDPLEIPIQNNDTYEDDNNFELLQPASEVQRFHDVQDLLAVKSTKRNTNKAHKLEERIGKLEASRSYCKGCFVKIRLGHITKDKIKQVNTFCPGCDGLPNYCKPCYKEFHKGLKGAKK